MPKFLATIENTKIIKAEEPIYNRGKVVKKSSGKLVFAISRHRKKKESRAVLFETVGRAVANDEETD